MTLNGRIKTCADKFRSFLMSDAYPIVICALTAIGSITGIEFYLAMIHIAVVFIAFIMCDSIKPVVISLLSFVMQLSVGHSPFYPAYSDYYYTGWRLPIVFVMGAMAAFGIIFFFIKNKLYKKISFKKTPLLLPLLILSSAFLLNGVFSGKWVLGDLVFGIANAVVYCFLFILLYHGFSDKEDSNELARYFSYVSMLIAFVIIAELSALFISSDDIFVDGSINKVGVALGWGIWNLVGVSLTVLIPAIFYGVHNNRYPWLYFTAATLALIFAVLTMSRNALLCGAAIYVICVIISCFKGKYKFVFRIITAVGIVSVLAFIAVFFGKIKTLLGDYFERGFSDNGRYLLWREAFDNFLESPIFGGGFYGFNVTDEELYSFGPLAKQAHNTILQLLSSTGIVGLCAYGYYRFESLRPLFRRPSMKKCFMALSCAVLLAGSLLDNFIFNIYPMFHYTVALVIIHKSAKEEAEAYNQFSEIKIKNKRKT